MKYSLYLSALFVLLLSACNVLPGQEPPTSTPAPTDTATPTLTPLPTETPTPVPTSTPDKTATAASEATETSDSIMEELDSLLGDTDIPYQDGHLLWKQGKPLMVSMKGPGWDYVEIDKDLVGKNFILKSDVTWEASGILMCGVSFRSEPNIEEGKQYLFDYLRLSGLPAWEIDVFQYGNYQSSITKVQFSDAIDQKNGDTNQVVLVAQDEQFTLYINNVRQGRYFDSSKQRTEGVFAFHGAQDSGEGTCNFENSWVWALE
ncbi:MAG TPA: hypothetical protein VJ785_13390 [Anaerolineales bacterium]|nr:hypothetical protein [Anaerolineales bacterium]